MHPLLLLVSLVFYFPAGLSVTLDDEAQSYLLQILKKFKDDPTNPWFDHVVEPPADRAYLPALFIWSPLEHFTFTMKCLKHPGTDVRPSGWTDDLLKKGSNKNPRLIFDLRRNILLVQRMYTCRKDCNHHYLAGSVELMSNFPISLRPNHFPFKKYHMSVATFDLIDYIFHQVTARVTFTQICECISSLNFAYFQRTIGFNKKSFHDNVMFSFPSRDKVETIFLDTYYNIKQLLESTRSLPSCSISIDNCYRVGRTYSDKNKKDQMKIITVLNENHEIVSWKASSESGDCEEYMSFLMDIKYKLDVTGTSLSYVFLDNCCEMREICTALFPGVVVKHDLYHAFSSITNCLPDKKVVHACIFAKDLKRIVRKADDIQDKREQETASTTVIMQNLIDVLTKQESFLNTLSEHRRQLILTQLELLKEHISMGCLSYIPPDQGSDSIEKYHQEFIKDDTFQNKYFIMSPELAIAIFAVLCATYNSRTNIRKHQCNVKIAPYLPKTYLSPFLQRPEEPGLLTLEDYALFSSGNLMSTNMLGKLAYDVYFVLNFLKKVKNSCDAIDFQVENTIKFVFPVLNQSASESTENSSGIQSETLHQNLKSFNLRIDKVPADGDCLFRSILMQVEKMFSTIEGRHEFVKHIENLGLRSTEQQEGLVLILRELFVKEIQSEERYKSYLTEEDMKEVESYRDAGVYASNVGDLVVDVCADVLGAPIIVISSMREMDVSIHLPKTKQQIDFPIVLAYSAFGSGHYDGTKDFGSASKDEGEEDDFCQCNKGSKPAKLSCVKSDKYSSRCPCLNKGKTCNFKCFCKLCGNSKSRLLKKDVSCRCGEGLGKKNTEVRAACTKGKRATKCPCNGHSSGCNVFCRCKNCENEYGVRPEKEKKDPSIKQKRKRSDCDRSYSRPKMSDFSPTHDNSLHELEKDWKIEEVATILCSVNLLLRIPGCNVVPESVHLVYSSARESYAINNMGMRLNMRTVEQIEEKMRELHLIDVFPVTYVVEQVEVQPMNEHQLANEILNQQTLEQSGEKELIESQQNDESIVSQHGNISILEQHEIGEHEQHVVMLEHHQCSEQILREHLLQQDTSVQDAVCLLNQNTNGDSVMLEE